MKELLLLLTGAVLLTGCGGSLMATPDQAATPASSPTPPAGSPTPAATPAAPGWELLWADEFDGPAGSQPSSERWNFEVTGNPANDELQYYTSRPENIFLNGEGQLVLQALREDYKGRRYTSGRINTAGKFERTYGRYEARMRLPRGTGLWPAFWLLGGDIGTVGWPNSGEIDIMENRGREPRVSSSAIHGPGYSGDTPIVHRHTLPEQTPDLFDDYHLYAVEWEPAELRFYVDGKLHYTVRPPEIERHGKWVLDHPFFIILNLAVGGVFDSHAVPEDSSFPARVLVDYVRVYRSSVEPTPAPRCGTTNIAEGRPASASSSVGERFGAAQAVNGSAASRWASQPESPQWLQVDLGEPRQICKVRLNWHASFATAYELQLSDDGQSWRTVAAENNGAGGFDEYELADAARYLRVLASASSTSQGYSLWELEIFAPEG